jgi:hypothetical protein
MRTIFAILLFLCCVACDDAEIVKFECGQNTCESGEVCVKDCGGGHLPECPENQEDVASEAECPEGQYKADCGSMGEWEGKYCADLPPTECVERPQNCAELGCDCFDIDPCGAGECAGVSSDGLSVECLCA